MKKKETAPETINHVEEERDNNFWKRDTHYIHTTILLSKEQST